MSIQKYKGDKEEREWIIDERIARMKLCTMSFEILMEQLGKVSARSFSNSLCYIPSTNHIPEVQHPIDILAVELPGNIDGFITFLGFNFRVRLESEDYLRNVNSAQSSSNMKGSLHKNKNALNYSNIGSVDQQCPWEYYSIVKLPLRIDLGNQRSHHMQK